MEHMLNENWLLTVPMIITSGIAGTTLMTAYLLLVGFATDKMFRTTKILGKMVTDTRPAANEPSRLSRKTLTSISGILIHYLMGILFMTIFFLLWKKGIGYPNYFSGIVFGFISGVAAIGIWYTAFRLRLCPPDVNPKAYFLHIFIGHFFFVWGCFYTFQILSRV
ncbi:hypothetical protein DYBT9275_05964 [Dyadobacter sp. CECT 9275]|uniref:DUF2938 domain-containing protein n=1 Tax=Dyadobacter helix TaxID=2822344 RepID=A0A916NE95_9BACT|nr:hypothetical protein [Dyadobacter sp. CECT 9275]CAG5018249.1 hypothetical protein DYBT9275_05964 [Dyadobacter sp. CECT 9275]